MKSHSQFRKSTAKDRQRPGLTARERKIAALVVDGFKDKEIGQRMLLPEQTVKNQIQKIFSKLGVCDRLALVFYVVDNKLVPSRNIKGESRLPMNATQSSLLQALRT